MFSYIPIGKTIYILNSIISTTLEQNHGMNIFGTIWVGQKVFLGYQYSTMIVSSDGGKKQNLGVKIILFINCFDKIYLKIYDKSYFIIILLLFYLSQCQIPIFNKNKLENHLKIRLFLLYTRLISVSHRNSFISTVLFVSNYLNRVH